MTIVITGVGGFRNRGVEAFTLPTVEHLRKDFPDQEITILTPTPDYDALRLDMPGVRLVRNDFSLGGGSPQMRRLRQTAARLLGREPRSDRNVANWLLKSAKMVVALGGDTFSSDYGQLYHHLAPLTYAQQHNVPVVFLAHSIGPFRTEAEAQAWSGVARKAALITVRESLTYKYVVEQLGIPETLVYLTYDPAFLLAPPPLERTRRMLEGYGIDPDCPRIALAVSQSIGTWSNVNKQAHFAAWGEAIQTLIDATEAQLLLVPHVQNREVITDDRIVATQLLRHFQFHPRLHLIGGDHSAAEFKGLIGSCDLVVAERMHAAIAGLSSGVCAVVIGYSVKAAGILGDLFPDTELKQDLLLSVQELATTGRFASAILDAWEKREVVRQTLMPVLTESRTQAEENYRLLLGNLDT